LASNATDSAACAPEDTIKGLDAYSDESPTELSELNVSPSAAPNGSSDMPQTTA
jgi:hypothetical protein